MYTYKEFTEVFSLKYRIIISSFFLFLVLSFILLLYLYSPPSLLKKKKKKIIFFFLFDVFDSLLRRDDFLQDTIEDERHWHQIKEC